MGLGRSLQGDKQGKRFKLATRAARVSNGVDGNSAFMEKKERKSKKVESGRNRAIGMSYAGESKGTRKGLSGRRNVKTRNNGEPHETLGQGNKSFKSLNLDKKRKSSDAVLFTAEERVSGHNAGRFNRKFPPKMGKDMHKDNSYEARKTTKKKLRNLEQASQNRAIGISYAGESKGTRKGLPGRRNVKTMNNGEPHETLAQGNKSFKSLNFDKKGKSSDAVLFTAEERVSDHNAGRFNKKSAPKMGQDMHRDNSYEARKTTKKKLHKLEQASQNALLAGRKNSGQSEFLDEKKSGAHALTKSKKNGGARNDKMNRSAQNKSVVTKQSEKEQIEVATVSVGRPSKKKVQDKKSTTDDSEGMDEPPKKKRRRIKIDPYDTSNKRLDDGIAIKDNVKKKEEDSRHGNAELSKNAQFRAIVPSPSILSFVEDNLLGRRREIEFRRAGYNIELSAPLDNIPHSSSSERERIEETVFRNKLTFFAAAKISSSFPPPELPEIAFAGRSNVGKSSLLNALTRQWGVVRTSDKPGLTQTINFFKLASKLCLVDLPGYGFAYAKEEVKEAWEELVKEYVSTRVGLKRVCLLVDTKWGMKPRDHELIDLMERLQTKYQIVLTKTDTVFPIDVARRAMQIEESLKEKKSAVQPVMMVSSKTGAGIRSLRTVLARIARFVKP